MRRTVAGILAVAAVLALASHAGAQRLPSEAGVIPAATGGGFERLPPEQQTIARSLFQAQRVTATGPAPLDLGEIAALKTGRTWPAVLEEMRGQGLVTAKTLQQVMRDYLRAIDGCRTAHRDARAGGTMMIVTANGQLFAAPRVSSGDDGALCAGDEDRRAGSLAGIEAGQ